MARYRAIHTAELRSDVDPDEFERFMIDEFLSETNKLPGCLDAQLLRGYTGDLPGTARAKVDYAWISLWESAEANNRVWSRDGKHYTPESIMHVNARLHHYVASYSLVGGFEIVE